MGIRKWIRRKAGKQAGGASGQPERTVVNAWYKGFRFRCFMEDPIGRFILTGIGWDNQCESLLQMVPNDAPHVIEVGANIGASLIPLANRYGDLEFHCFEPVPEFRKLLLENRENCNAENARVINKACGARLGDQVEIFVQSGTAGALREYDGHTQHGAIQVEVTTIDHYVQQGALSVGLLKIDVDGHETVVLDGARSTLETQSPLLFIEFHSKLMRTMGIEPESLLNTLTGHGYSHMRIWDNFGNFIRDTDSADVLLQETDNLQYYADVLFSKIPINA